MVFLVEFSDGTDAVTEEFASLAELKRMVPKIISPGIYRVFKLVYDAESP